MILELMGCGPPGTTAAWAGLSLPTTWTSLAHFGPFLWVVWFVGAEMLNVFLPSISGSRGVAMSPLFIPGGKS